MLGLREKGLKMGKVKLHAGLVMSTQWYYIA